MGSDVSARSRSHFLTHDDEGWALWGVDQDSDEPLLRFAPDDAGEERARTAFEIRSRETRRVRVLAVAAVIAGALWLTLALTGVVVQELLADDGLGIISFEEQALPVAREVSIWIAAAQGVANVAFEVSVGMFIVAWLQRRWRREG